MRRNLLDDLNDVYYSLPCEDINNESCRGCRYCKNKNLCLTIIKLISSIEKFY